MNYILSEIKFLFLQLAMNPLVYIPVGPQRLGVDVKTAMRVRNMSGGSTGSLESDLSRSWGSTSSAGFESVGPINALNSPVGLVNAGEPSSDRSNGQSQNNKNILNPGRYKTEMCRPFNETGHCKYGDKCQFAHGSQDLRGLPRHPKYKTELCRTFHTVGFCPYGPRCHFIHSEDEGKLVEINAMKQQQAAQQAAREMAQLHAQQHLLTSQFTALVSQVHLANHMVTAQPPPPPVYNSPSQFIAIPTTGLPPPMTLPHHLMPLGSTADSPPDSPIGSISDDVFHMASSSSSSTGSIDPPPTAEPIQSLQRPVSSALLLDSPVTPTAKLEGLGMALESMVLDPNPHQQQQQQSLSTTTFTAMSELTVSPPSSPDSLCSSLDSQRSSRLPVFSKLAGDN